MSCMVWCFGAPVIEPQGKRARNTAGTSMPGKGSASTVEVICHKAPWACTWKSCGTRTLPTRAKRPRSLRSKSVIMRFSARFFGSPANQAAAAASRSGSVKQRAAVPFIGCVLSRPA